MTIEIWIYYLVAVLVLTAAPGPSSLLCMSTGVSSGIKAGTATALGSLTAITIILTLSFTGLGVVVVSSELVFNLVKWLGAGYLIYLGVTAFRSKQVTYDVELVDKRVNASWRPSYVKGFLVGASNPKAIVFFTALFPQFINPEADLFVQYLVFAATFVVLEFSWLMLYIGLGVKSSRWLFAEGRAKLFNRLTGGTFVGLGVMLSATTKD